MDIESNGGETALMWAAEKGHIVIVDKLLAAGADVEKTVRWSWSNGDTTDYNGSNGDTTD